MAYSEWKNAGSQVYYLGTGTSFNIAQKLPNDYQNLTADNFIVVTKSSSSWWRWEDKTMDGNWIWYTEPSKSYNPSTGILTIGNNTIKSRVSRVWDKNVIENTMTCTSAVYLVIGDIETV